MEHFWKHAVKETLLAAVVATVFCLFAASLLAVFVRAFAPSDTTIAILDRGILALGVLLPCLFFVRPERSLFKGAAAGVLALLLTTLVFGLIGGFRFSVLWLADLLLAVLFGGLGALLGAKFRKE